MNFTLFEEADIFKTLSFSLSDNNSILNAYLKDFRALVKEPIAQYEIDLDFAAEIMHVKKSISQVSLRAKVMSDVLNFLQTREESIEIESVRAIGIKNGAFTSKFIVRFYCGILNIKSSLHVEFKNFDRQLSFKIHSSREKERYRQESTFKMLANTEEDESTILELLQLSYQSFI